MHCNDGFVRHAVCAFEAMVNKKEASCG
jgi:hypothetical protein